MHLDTQTTIFMICFVYLMLHGAIWLALLEYRSFQVKLWCASGMISGVAVVLLAIRDTVPDVVFLRRSTLDADWQLGAHGGFAHVPATDATTKRPSRLCGGEHGLLCSLLLSDLFSPSRVGSLDAVQWFLCLAVL